MDAKLAVLVVARGPYVSLLRPRPLHLGVVQLERLARLDRPSALVQKFAVHRQILNVFPDKQRRDDLLFDHDLEVCQEVMRKGYSIKMVSDNRGVLRPEFTQSSIDYDVFLDGNVVSLEGSPPNDVLLSAVTNSHHRMDLLITGNTETGLAGHYSDRLTLVISAD